MQEFLRCELKRIASFAPIGEWLEGVRDRAEAADSRVPPSVILAARDCGDQGRPEITVPDTSVLFSRSEPHRYQDAPRAGLESGAP